MLQAKWILVAVVIFSPGLVFAAPCTRGVNCYCDKVKPGGPLADPQLLLCEDFEAPTLHDDVGFGNGAPDFGPWYDDTGQPGNRGNNNYWARTYGPVGGCNWTNGRPAIPRRGATCAFSACNAGAWRKDALWNANDPVEYNGTSGACMTIIRNGEFQDEIPTLTDPPLPGGVHGVFDGSQSFAHRVCAGPGCLSGIKGEKPWPGGARTTFGITMAVAYPANIMASGIFGAPWKHNEWASVVDPIGGFEGLFLFHVVNGPDSEIPFKHFILFKTGSVHPEITSITQAGCQAAVAAATIRKGNIFCDSISFRFHADPSYIQSVHWPFGTWGCVRGYYQNFGTNNVSIKITLTTAVVTDMVIVDFDGFDDTGFNSRLGFTSLKWNAYANANQGTGETPTVLTALRYEDNVHIRAGQPVSCAQIGFPAGSPPNAPTGLLVR